MVSVLNYPHQLAPYLFRNRLNGLQIVSKKSCFPFCIYADLNFYLTWMVGITKHFPQLEHKITYMTG